MDMTFMRRSERMLAQDRPVRINFQPADIEVPMRRTVGVA